MKLRIVHKGLIYLCLPLILQGLFFFELFNLIAQTERSMEQQTAHINMSRELNFTIIQFCRTLAMCGNGGARSVLPVAEYRTMMESHLTDLEKDIANTSEDYRQVIASARKLITAQYKVLEVLQSPGERTALDDLHRWQILRNVVTSAEAAAPFIYDAWGNEEKLLARERLKEQHSREKLKQLVLTASIFDFFLALIFIVVFIKNITQRLNLLMANARVITNAAALPNKVSGSDEIAFLDQALHDASSELTKAAGYRRSLLEMMAHDLRNPLMSMSVAIEVLLKSTESGKVSVPETRLRSFTQSLRQITTLMEDLLALDRMEATELQLDLSLIKLGNLVSDVRDLIAAQAEEKSITIETQIVEVSVIGDRNRLLQVLSNLVGNAIRYSPAKSTIKIVVSRNEKVGKISVVDNGPGIAKQFHSQLFEKFFQVQQPGKISGGLGYGLGLAICKQIMVKHAGNIGVDSEPGNGSTFWISWPLDEEEDEGND